MGRILVGLFLVFALAVCASELPFVPDPTLLMLGLSSIAAGLTPLFSRRWGFALLGFGIVVLPGFHFEGTALFVTAWLCGSGVGRFFRAPTDRRIFHSGFEAGEMAIAVLILASIIAGVRALHLEYDRLLMSALFEAGGWRGVLRYLVEHTREWTSIPFLVIGYPLALLLFAELGRDSESTTPFARGLACGAALSSAVLLLQVADIFPVLSFNRSAFWVMSDRFGGLASDPNSFGVLAVLLVPFFVYFREAGGHLLAVGAAFTVFAVPWTGSRTFWLGALLFALAALTAKFRRRRGALPTFLAALIIVTAAVGYPTLNDRLQERITSQGAKRVLETLHWERGGAMLANRLMYAEIAVEVWREAPVLGIGLGKFYERQAEAAKRVGFDLGEWRDNANNYYLQVLAEQGVLGLALTLFAFHLLLVAISGESESRNTPLRARYYPWLFFLILLTGPHLLFNEVKFVFAGTLALLIRRTGPVDSPRLVRETRWAFWWVLTGALCAVVFYVPVVKRQAVEGAYGLETTPEGPILWTSPKARFLLCPETANPISIEFRLFHPRIVEDPVRVTFSLDSDVGGGVREERLVATSEWQRIELAPVVSTEPVRLSLRTDRSWSPARDGVSADSRWFGVMLKYTLPLCKE